MIKKLLHKISHLFKLNTGRIIGWNESGIAYIGFQCDRCGLVEGKTVSIFNYEKDEENDSTIETK